MVSVAIASPALRRTSLGWLYPSAGRLVDEQPSDQSKAVYTTDRNGYPRSRGCDFWYVFLMTKRYLKMKISALSRARVCPSQRTFSGNTSNARIPRVFSGTVQITPHLPATCRSHHPHVQGLTPTRRCRAHSPAPDHAKRDRTAVSHLSTINQHNRAQLPWASTIGTITRDMGDLFETTGESIIGGLRDTGQTRRISNNASLARKHISQHPAAPRNMKQYRIHLFS